MGMILCSADSANNMSLIIYEIIAIAVDWFCFLRLLSVSETHFRTISPSIHDGVMPGINKYVNN